MKSHQPPFSITNTMLIYVSSISEKLGKISMQQTMESRPYLRRNNRIKSIHSSLKIEANSLSLRQVRDVIDGHLVLGEQKEIQEEGVFNGENCIFIAPPAKFVPELMKELFDWMKREQTSVHPLILSSVFHYEFVFIHPFSDGNGRMARLWHTALLSRWKPVFEYIPIESQIEKFQDGYYRAISQCHSEGTSNTFIEFMLKQIDMILDDISNQISEDNPQITEYVKKLLSVMDLDRAYAATDIMNKLGLKSKETFRKNYLNPALDLNLVEMTIPDKPKSRNQKYIRT